MSGISSGVGLVSGIDHQQIISQLIQVERRSIDQIRTRMAALDTQKSSFLDLSARIAGMLSRLGSIGSRDAFRSAAATSSNTAVLAATARAGATVGTFQFAVKALAATQQSVSRGFAAANSAVGAGSITIESAQARVDRETDLSGLNGGAGVQRGSFKITNRAGQSATVSISDAVTLNEVLERINAAGVGVTASVRGDALELRDGSSGAGTLRIQDLDGGQAAAQLGFDVTRAIDLDNDGKLLGASVTRLTTATNAAALNDGLGVRRSVAGGDFSVQTALGDFTVDLSDILKPETRLARLNQGSGVRLGVVRITSRNGDVADVNLTSAKTVGDVETALESAFGGGRISVTLNGSRLVITDGSTIAAGQTATNLKFEDVSGNTALDLGIDGAGVGERVDGREILRVRSVADVLAAINFASGNAAADGAPILTASLASDGQRFQLSSAAGSFTLVAGQSGALADLGFSAQAFTGAASGARVAAGLNTALLRTLNGGGGLETGIIQIAGSAGTATIDLAGAETLADALERIRTASADAGLELTIGYDSSGTRLSIADASGAPLTISDVFGKFAERSGLAGVGATRVGSNLQRQYISENTALASLNNGKGVGLGKIRFTNTVGVQATLDLGPNSPSTVGELLRSVRDLGIGLTARINDTGDGFLIEDSNGGAGTLKLEDVEGAAARDLALLSPSVGGRITGSFELKIDVSGADTLESLAARVNNTTNLASAALINDGTASTPYRLSLVSKVGGRAGALIIDDSGLSLGLTTLTRAQDARVLFGGENGLLLTSNTNTISNAVSGLTLNAVGVADAPVTVTVEQSHDGVLADIKSLIEDFNSTIDRIKEVGGYNAETEERGVLLGDAALRTVENRLSRMFTRVFVGTGSRYSRLFEVGVTLGDGGKLSFDEDKFAAEFERDPTAVADFFTKADVGVAAVLKSELEALTDDAGVIPNRTGTFDSQRELLDDRVAVLEERLSAKQARLERQFLAMETALSQLQSQQTALSSLASLTTGASS